MNLKEALSQLDASNDEHWTADGMPRIDAVEKIIGEKGVRRQDITNAAPDFTRQTAKEQASLGAEEQAADKPTGETAEAETVGQTTHPEQEEEAPAHQERELSPVELLESARDELAKEMLEAQRISVEAKARADQLANEVNSYNRRIEVMQKSDPNYGTAGVRAYINQQNENRRARARGLQRFIDSTGMHPRDVVKAVDPKAPIDRAMGQRRPALGANRPSFMKSNA